MALSALLDFEMQSAMWSLHCNFWSKMTPKTLIDFVDVMISLFNLTLIGGGGIFLIKQAQASFGIVNLHT